MLEMLETAAILNQSTENSLVILDEVGRGTSTEDGLAISQAVLEYLHNYNKCRTFFSTHFRELCHLETTLTKLNCYTTKIVEWENEVIFLYEIEKGKSNKAYGIYIAKLAGLPQAVIERADILLKT